MNVTWGLATYALKVGTMGNDAKYGKLSFQKSMPLVYHHMMRLHFKGSMTGRVESREVDRLDVWFPASVLEAQNL